MRVEIRSAKFLIADLTDENRGAYWEAGFAEGFGKKVYYTCEASKFEDWLPLAPELREHLRALYRRREHPEYVFINPLTDRPFNQRRRLLRSICRQAGVRPFGYHAIRHMGADRLMHAGEDLRTISRFLRHKSLATTEQYLRRRPDESLKKSRTHPAKQKAAHATRS